MSTCILTTGAPKRIGFISTRFYGTDGVTLEARKWAHILDAVQHAKALSADQAKLALLTGIGLAYLSQPSKTRVTPRPKKPNLSVEIQNMQVLDQQRLNVVAKTRSNIFGWRGQFTPAFADYMLDESNTGTGLVLDPFCGSGTVLVECATWNCRHLANPHLQKPLRSFMAAHELTLPEICTPIELAEH